MKTMLDANGLLNLDELIMQSSSFQKIMEDGAVTEEELQVQSDKVMELMEEMQRVCNDEQLAIVKALIAEMNVLYAAYHYMNLKSIQD